MKMPSPPLEAMVKSVSQSPEARIFMDFPKAVLILNHERKIVFANQKALSLFHPQEVENPHGLRLGDALHCIHRLEENEVCGTTPFCRFCGAARSMETALLSPGETAPREGDEECRITRILDDQREALNLNCWSRLFSWQGEDYLLFMAEDISREMENANLERFFHHDLLNSVTSLKSLVTLLRMEEEFSRHPYLAMAETTISDMVDQIHEHRDLQAAEKKNLALRMQWIEGDVIVDRVARIYQNHSLSQGKDLIINREGGETHLHTDPVILKRILGNMLKNALESAGKGDTVTLVSRREGDTRYVLEVRNPQVMKEEVQRQIFNRAYSTKGTGRGLGTYSMKLFGEDYLGGKVSFSSRKPEGTIFRLSLPLNETAP